MSGNGHGGRKTPPHVVGFLYLMNKLKIKISLLTTLIILSVFSVHGHVEAEVIEPGELINPAALSYQIDWNDLVTTYVPTTLSEQYDYLYIEDINIEESGKASLFVSYKMEQANVDFVELANLSIPGVRLKTDSCTEGYLKNELRGKKLGVVLSGKGYEPKLVTIYSTDTHTSTNDLANYLITNGFARISPALSGVKSSSRISKAEQIVGIDAYGSLADNLSREDLRPEQEMADLSKTGIWWQKCSGTDSKEAVLGNSNNIDSKTIRSPYDEALGMFVGSMLASIILMLAMYFLLRRFIVDESGQLKPWLYTVGIVSTVLSVFLFEFSLVPLLAITSGVLIVKYSENRKWLGIILILISGWYLMINIFMNLGII